MSLRVGQKVRIPNGLEGFLVEKSLLCPWQWWVTIGRCTARYDEDTLTPVAEPDKPCYRLSCPCCAKHQCVTGDYPCRDWSSPHAYASRLGLGPDNPRCALKECEYPKGLKGITCELKNCTNRLPDPEPDPELFICSKAGECGEVCCHKDKHPQNLGCDMPPICREDATCIPYVPEDEVREWFIVASKPPQWATEVFSIPGRCWGLTEKRAREIARTCPEYRAFRWSAGLKGGE